MADDYQAGNFPQIRVQLSRLSRNKKTRIVEFSRKRPSVWQPNDVISPESGLPFTEPGAWEFIAELLDSGHPMSAVDLDFPPGCKAYSLTVRLQPERTPLYIKLELGGSGKVFGRSFHYSRYNQ